MAIDRIYIDSCCFIESITHKFNQNDAINKDRENDIWTLEKLFEASTAGELTLITSYLTIAECTHVKGIVDDEVKRLIKSILESSRVIDLSQVTLGVAELARDLLWIHGMKFSGADAVHVASAIITECKEFLSFDRKKNKSPLAARANLKSSFGLSVIEPRNTQLLPQDYRQSTLL